jgi:hypothetical protein
MKKEIQKIFKNKFVKYLIIPILLIVLWLVLTSLYIYTFDTSLSVISYIHNRDSITHNNYSKLIKGQKLKGEFEAKENNLGIVAVKFKTYIRPRYKDEDTIIFRIKEKGNPNWIVENSYRNGLMYEVEPFTFGLPKILDSKGRRYYFEIESIKGNENNAIAISNRGQILFSKYQVSKNLLLHDYKQLFSFIYKKFISSLLTTDVRFSSFIYILPLIFYILLISPLGKQILNPLIKIMSLPVIPPLSEKIVNPINKVIYNLLFLFISFLRKYIVPNLNWFLIIIICIDIIIVQVLNNVIYIVIGVLWFILLKTYKKDSKSTFLVAIFLLILAPIFIFLIDSSTAEKAAIWAFIFLVTGVIQIIFEFKNEKNE